MAESAAKLLADVVLAFEELDVRPPAICRTSAIGHGIVPRGSRARCPAAGISKRRPDVLPRETAKIFLADCHRHLRQFFGGQQGKDVRQFLVPRIDLKDFPLELVEVDLVQGAASLQGQAHDLERGPAPASPRPRDPDEAFQVVSVQRFHLINDGGSRDEAKTPALAMRLVQRCIPGELRPLGSSAPQPLLLVCLLSPKLLLLPEALEVVIERAARLPGPLLFGSLSLPGRGGLGRRRLCRRRLGRRCLGGSRLGRRRLGGSRLGRNGKDLGQAPRPDSAGCLLQGRFLCLSTTFAQAKAVSGGNMGLCRVVLAIAPGLRLVRGIR
eukprot:scaffold109_cov252-Pinguiococcus_pyrenoidosus.AAC.58